MLHFSQALATTVVPPVFISLACPHLVFSEASQTPAVLPRPEYVGATPTQCSDSSADTGLPQSAQANTTVLKAQDIT